MNCKQALRLLYEVIDREAEEIDSAEVEKHLKNCRHCMAQYEFERMFKTFVVENGRNTRDNSELKSKISSHLDDIDAAGEVGPPRFPFRRTVIAIASAAALILFVLASFKVSDFYRHRTEIAPFIDAYAAHTENSPPISDYETGPLEYLERQTGINLSAAHLPVGSIQSVSVDTIKGVQFGRIEILDPHNEKAAISIFVTTATHYTLPSKPSEEIDGHRMLVHRCEQCNVVGSRRDDLIFMVVSPPCCEPDHLARLASSL